MSFNEQRVRDEENELIILLMFLVDSYLARQINKATLIFLAETALTNTHDKIIQYISRSPLARETVAVKELSRAKADFREQASDLDEYGELIKPRIKSTASYIAYSTFNRAILDMAHKAGKKQIRYVTAADERVCVECVKAEGTYDLEKVPIPPQHVNCRCYLSLT